MVFEPLRALPGYLPRLPRERNAVQGHRRGKRSHRFGERCHDIGREQRLDGRALDGNEQVLLSREQEQSRKGPSMQISCRSRLLGQWRIIKGMAALPVAFRTASRSLHGIMDIDTSTTSERMSGNCAPVMSRTHTEKWTATPPTNPSL